MKEIDFPIKPIRINCRTCKGEGEIINPKFLIEKENRVDKIYISCPHCEGKGEYLVKKL